MKQCKNITMSIIMAVVIALSGFIVFEPLEIQGASANDAIVVTQIVTSEITISAPADVSMSASIPGITGNADVPTSGSATWTVKTNNSTGFSMTLAASTNSALKNANGDSFANYTAASAATPDYSWSVAAGAAEFGYTVEPATAADTDSTFKDNGSSTCATSTSQTTGKCWLGFNTTSAETIVNRSTETLIAGEAEKVKFNAEFDNTGTTTLLPSGTYTATITATATTN